MAAKLDVAAMLQADTSKYASTEVTKDLDLDEGNLLAYDEAPPDEKRLKNRNSKREKYLKELTRDNTQGLFNSIWELPTVRVADAVLCQLPAPSTALPREKPVPEDKEETKWEKYAKLKGIQKKKKSRMVFDESTGTYKPNWGYQRANDDTKDWIAVLPDQADKYTDVFEERAQAKKDRVNKNKKQQANNIRAASNKKNFLSETSSHPQIKRKTALEKDITLSKTSTASLGRFDEKLKSEPKIRLPNAKRTKFSSNVESSANRGAEKSSNIALLNKVLNSNGMDKKKAVEPAKGKKGKGKGKRK